MGTAPTIPKPQQDAHQGRDLNSAILACFSPDITTPAFEDRLTELTAALTNQLNVSVWTEGDAEEPPQSIAQSNGAKTGEVEENTAGQVLDKAKTQTGPIVIVIDPYLCTSVALPGAKIGVVLVELPTSSAMARSLTYERLTLIAHLSFNQFHNSDLIAQSRMIQTLVKLARGDDTQLQLLVDTLAQLTGADYASAGLFQRGTLGSIAISGQTGPAKRAQLPAKLRTTMNDIIAKKVSGTDRFFAAADGANGLALIVEKPVRNHGILQLAGGVYRQAQHSKPKSKWTATRFAKIGAAGLIAIGILLIPIPDGVELSARVEASERRVITAPLSASIAQVFVRDRQQVSANVTPLLRLDASEIEIDLIGAQAERTTAVLERENARLSRNAALLRNAELEVTRLEARIGLLDLQRDSSTLIAPISGIAILPELEQRVGSTVRQGDVLMEVADPTSLRLELAILESRISKVEDGATGIFRPDFDPTLRLRATITTISPSVDNSKDVPVIQARAEFDEVPTKLRPGLSGVFSVNQEYRPMGQVIYRTLRNWVLLRVWI